MDESYKERKVFGLVDRYGFMKDDPLKFVIRTVNFNIENHIFYTNSVKFLIIVYLQTFNIIGIGYIFNDSNKIYLRKYISIILIQQYGIISYAIQIYYSDLLITVFKELARRHFLPLHACGEKLHKKLLRGCALTKSFVILIFALQTFGLICFMPLLGDEEDIHFAIMFIGKHFGKWAFLFKGIYYFCILSFAYSFSTICAIALYILTHVKFQFTLLTAYLNDISHNYKPNIENAVYQKVIQKRLKSCIRAHNNIKEASVLFLETGHWSLLAIAIAAVLAFTGFLYFMTMNANSLSNFRMVVGITFAAFSTIIITIYGQQLQNESTKLYYATYECPWIYWNKQNRKTLLMMMVNTSNIMKMTSFGVLDLGNEILLRISKLVYSLTLLFVNQY